MIVAPRTIDWERESTIRLDEKGSGDGQISNSAELLNGLPQSRLDDIDL
jgi:hypothetical protein